MGRRCVVHRLDEIADGVAREESVTIEIELMGQDRAIGCAAGERDRLDRERVDEAEATDSA